MDETQGIIVNSKLPEIAGRYGGPLLIMGGGRCVWEDLERIDSAFGGNRMAVNDIMAYYQGEIMHGVSLHPEYLPGWIKFRQGHNFGNGAHVFTHSNRRVGEYPECLWDLDNLGGTSGLFAIFIAFLMGYKSIVLAGIPMDGSGHFFDPHWIETDFSSMTQFQVWTWARDNIFKGRVKSLSGNTRRWLGEPQ
jgi:hypothetical protein